MRRKKQEMRRLAALFMVLVVGLVTLASCSRGVDVQEYVKVTNQLKDAQAEISRLKNENSALSQQISDLEIENENLKAEIAGLKQASPRAPAPTPATRKVVITFSSTTMTQIGTGILADKPEAGHVYLVLDLSIENQGYDSFSASPFYFYLVINNVKYSTALVFNLENELMSVDVLDGGRVTGKLAFEVPLEAVTRGYQITYEGFETYNIEWVRR